MKRIKLTFFLCHDLDLLDVVVLKAQTLQQLHVRLTNRVQEDHKSWIEK